MNHRIALSFEDGVTRFITCTADQTVADASYRARINIPLDCRDGACGTCKAFCESGDYDGGTYIDDALTSEEAANGYVLPCSMKPKSDLVLQIRSPSAVAKTQPTRYTATITALDRLSPTTVAMTAEIVDRDTLAFLPGQYVNIAVPGTEQSRSYSFSNGPTDKSLTFLIKLTPGGVMSEYLTERAAVSDELTFLGPNGSFFLRETERAVLLLAGGTGLAPVLSILRAMRASGTSRPAHLIYGVSTDDDLVELDTLAELASGLDGFTWDYCVSAPGSTAPNKGYVTNLIHDEHLYGGDVAVYLCGPPAMVESVRKDFSIRGIEPTGFYYEKFALSGTATPARPVDATPDSGADDTAVAEPEATVSSRADTETLPQQPDSIMPAPEAGSVSATGALGGRTIAGQEVFHSGPLAPLGAANQAPDDSAALRSIAGRAVWPGSGGSRELDPGDPIQPVGSARDIAGQQLFLTDEVRTPLVAPAENTGGYEIGEEHPSSERSKATMRRAMTDAAGEQRPAFISPGRFDGKVVVVTGAAQGIGERTARRISAEGGAVVLVDRSELVTRVAGELPRSIAVTTDLETWQGAQHMVTQALSRHGRIDILINNVGGAIWFKPFTEFTAAQIQAEITRSLMTTLLACRAALPAMAERGAGVIVNVSSAATRGIHRIPYSAAKGGINALTASLALEYADAGIRVVATAPGGTHAPPRRISRGGSAPTTGQEQTWFQAHIDQTVDSSLMKRYGTLDEQAAAITFLASDEASYITGTVLPVAGGDLG
ncbi:1,6-dihydroxycyclohexa-2,4-diene-1-carboxylate dehydrogenase [Nocardia sp. NEAU-G5]|uniref:1,6-dihydroxycyclohexa-2,4-diene-1-carboxylate dehydrogenase n=1 Tax=Nocardia albiluteola TaxID=2842303 RepID=A0ABS6BED0_9NOCA|nr:benzoate 1,2-dioxygenase electron transfer component BenC [Nocardia albiluteola]MBU3067856.1 1,6-dihydroxycyclohexa-2,4-diene-1-carboxylate dehydrogenase [Nocardia albiluteola]